MKRLHYGWIMVAVATVALAVHAVMLFSFGIFLVPLTREFNWGRGDFSGALSINFLVSGGFGILTGRLSDKYGPRLLATINGVLTGIAFLLLSQISALWQVYLVWGLPLAIAGSTIFVPVISTIPRWFTKARGLAVGIVSAGFSLGGMVMPQLAQWLISAYSWRQAYIFLGLIYPIVVISLAQFMKQSPQRVGLEPYGEGENIEVEHTASVGEGLTVNQAVKTARLWILISIIFCFHLALQAILAHIVAHAIDSGISAAVAASALSLIAGGGALGKLSMGFISDKIGTRPALIASLFTITSALIWLLFSTNTWMLFLFAAIFGYAYGCIVTLQSLIQAELFGLKFLGMIMATVMLGATIGGAVGPPMAGIIFDITGSYRLAFLILVIFCALAVTLSLLLLRSARKGGTLTSKD